MKPVDGTVVVVPGRPPAPSEGSGPGRLAATLLQVALAASADSARFRRGKAYVSDRSVTRLEVSAGVLRATVLGSRRDPYDVVVSSLPVARPADLVGFDLQRHHVMQLVPDADAVRHRCTCPDGADPCKHAVAAVMTFANEVIVRPELLVTWRCHADDGPRATVGSRRSSPRAASRQPPPPNPYASPEWVTFLASPDDAAIPNLNVAVDPPPKAPLVVDQYDVGAALREAIDALVTLANGTASPG